MENNLERFVGILLTSFEDKKAVDVRTFEYDQNFFVDVAIIVEAKNKIHMRSLSECLAQVLKNECQLVAELFLMNKQLNGNPSSGWMIWDLGCLVVHFVDQDKRIYYKLDEKLSECSLSVYHC